MPPQTHERLKIKHVLPWKKDTNTYGKKNVWIRKWLNALIISSSMDELNIRVNEKFDLMSIIE